MGKPYEGLKKNNVLSPLTPPHLAALFPPDVNVAIRNEQVQEVDYDIDVDLVITFLIMFSTNNMGVDEHHSSYFEVWKEMNSVTKAFCRVFKNFPIPISRFLSFLWKFLDNGVYLSQNLIGKYPLVGVK